VESLAKLKKADCPDGKGRPNRTYPIAGRIGIDELVSTYVRLERLTRLTKEGINVPLSGKIPVVFSDKLEFTTEFSAGVKPQLTLATIPGDFRLSVATVGADAVRKDTHNVTVALARDGTSVEPPARIARMAAEGAVGLSRQGARQVDAVVETSAAAKDRVLYELERRRVLDEDEELTTKFLEALSQP
jgi:hypothetical protein